MGEKKILTEELIDERLRAFADRVIQAQPREFMTFQEFREKVCDWSDDTIRRRHKNEGFPLVRDGAGYVIPRKKMQEWFKAREVYGS